MALDLKSASLSAARVLLRPVVRLMIRAGISFKEFADLSKSAYVEVATGEFGIRGRPTNVARVSILTGINRREVARLRELLAQSSPATPAYLNAAQRVLTGWHLEPAYVDAAGAPREIPVEGPAPSFADLCDRLAGDVPASTLLKELRNVDCLVAVEGGRLRALSRVYIPAKLDPQKVLRAGSVLQDIGQTVVHDLICGPKELLRFERRAENDRIDPQHLPAFRALLEQEGQSMLERVDAWLSQHEAPPGALHAEATGRGRKAEPRPLLRLGVGIYHIQNDVDRGES
ncbi:MAG: DUF6502 family protein [Steroidobacteraceae bacterium]